MALSNFVHFCSSFLSFDSNKNFENFNLLLLDLWKKKIKCLSRTKSMCDLTDVNLSWIQNLGEYMEEIF